MIIPLTGYAPDANPVQPGLVTNCSAIVPSLRGLKAAPSAQNITYPALSAAAQGSAVVRKLDDTTRFFAGTTDAIYEAVAGAWTDRTRSVGGAYALGSDVRWRFSQFGNVTLAAAKSDTLQSSTSGAFADISGAPKASIVETVGQFVFLFDTNEATYSDSPNRWWCCAKGDHTDWTPATSTECATGILTSSPGRILAGRRFGDGVVVYKDRSMFIGRYVGAPAVWDFAEVPGEIGATSQEVVINIGTTDEPKHIFMGFEDFYVFDGARPSSIGIDVKQTVFGELNKQYAFGCWALHDRINGLVYFFYPSTSSINPDKCVVYNYRNQKWGRDDRTIEGAVEYITAGIAYDDLGTSFTTYADLPNISYDSSFWTSGFPIPAIFNTSHRIQTLDGTPATSSITTGDVGDDNVISLVTRVRPRFIQSPSSASMTNFYRDGSGDTLTQDQTVALSSGKFDLLKSARWHRFSMSFNGSMEITGYTPTMQEDGLE